VSGICTLELNTRELKILDVERGRPVRHAQVLLPDGAYHEGVPTRTLVEFLLSTVRSTKVSAHKTRLAITDAGIAVRDFWLPQMPRIELPSAVAFEAKRLIPMDPGEVYYAWHPREARQGTAIYLVAARREMVDALVAAVTAVGLRVDRIDLKALALARGAAVSDGMVLDWGVGEATLVLLANGRPAFFRSLLLDAPEGDIRAQFDELRLSINALVKFIRSAEPDLSIGPSTPLFLSGRFATLEGAEAMAREKLSYGVRWPRPQGRWRPDFPWQAHLTGLGLLRGAGWEDRIVVTGGTARAAA